jgi:formylglycine-generating enzyme required for sulfatase activity
MTTHAPLLRALALGALTLAACAPAPAATTPIPTLKRPAPTRTPTPFALATHPIHVVIQAVTAAPTVRPTPTLVDSGPLPRLQAESLTWISPSDGMKLIGIPAGGFWMGSDKNDVYAEPDEWPLRRVQLAGFWIDETEVTNAMYARCVEAGSCTPPPTAFGAFSPHPYYADAAYDDYPAVNVTWDQANEYCAWAGRRLPTEAEWEKAARGLGGYRFPWEWVGVADPTRLNFCDQTCNFAWHVAGVDDGYPETAPVGSYPRGASPYGVLDMAGNVWEWTADWYSATYYEKAPLRDPLGPETGLWRVVRGGSWLDGVRGRTLVYARSANRYYQPPDAARSDIGFRCALSAEP